MESNQEKRNSAKIIFKRQESVLTHLHDYPMVVIYEFKIIISVVFEATGAKQNLDSPRLQNTVMFYVELIMAKLFNPIIGN